LERNFNIPTFDARVRLRSKYRDPIRIAEPMQFYLEAYLYDHQESLRQAMAGCTPIRRKEIISNSRLQRLSAILNVFS